MAGATPRSRNKTIREADVAADAADSDAANEDAANEDAGNEDAGSENDGSATDEGADAADEVADAADEVAGASLEPGDSESTGDLVVDEYQRELKSRRKATIDNARRRGGAAGAAMAGVMLTMQEMIEGEKEDAPVVVQANSDPDDMDEDGIYVELEGTGYHAPPLERIDDRDDRART